MTTRTYLEIANLERRLRDAMRESNVEELDALLADDLVFTDHRGALWGKAEDLATHRSGRIQVASVEASEEQVRVLDGLAIVSVRLEIAGTFGGAPASGAFRFTRVWAPTGDDRWQVVSAHSTMIDGDAS